MKVLIKRKALVYVNRREHVFTPSDVPVAVSDEVGARLLSMPGVADRVAEPVWLPPVIDEPVPLVVDDLREFGAVDEAVTKEVKRRSTRRKSARK